VSLLVTNCRAYISVGPNGDNKFEGNLKEEGVEVIGSYSNIFISESGVTFQEDFVVTRRQLKLDPDYDTTKFNAIAATMKTAIAKGDADTAGQAANCLAFVLGAIDYLKQIVEE
jgi:hypothetical protein